MNNTRFGWSITFLKLSLMMFTMVYLCSMLVGVIIEGFIRGGGFDISKQPNAFFILSFSMFWALTNTSRNRNIYMELDIKGNKGEEMLEKVKDILSSMRLKAVKEDKDHVIFKSTLTSTILMARITARVEGKKLKLTGAAYYVKRLADKL